MAADKYLGVNASGRIVQLSATDTSAGAANAGDIVALDGNGYISYSMLRSLAETYTDQDPLNGSVILTQTMAVTTGNPPHVGRTLVANSNPIISSGASCTGNMAAIQAWGQINSATHQGTLTGIYGFYGLAGISACGTSGAVTTATAFQAAILNDDSDGTIGTAVLFGGGSVGSTGTITDCYGLKIGALYGTNKYNIWCSETSAESFIGGRLRATSYAETANNLGSLGATPTFNLVLGNYISGTVSQAITSITISNVPVSGQVGNFTLELTNGAAYSITWPTSFKWPGGIVPSLTAAGKDIIVATTRDGGTTWYASVAILDVK